jgi:hypothetical protein|tara:strand:- start:492 stop:632 length:141 start_codon:yes stop_codon:yes gene_type:complete
MKKTMNILERLIKELFTGRLTLHYHLGVIKKITKEEEIVQKVAQKK